MSKHLFTEIAEHLDRATPRRVPEDMRNAAALHVLAMARNVPLKQVVVAPSGTGKTILYHALVDLTDHADFPIGGGVWDDRIWTECLPSLRGRAHHAELLLTRDEPPPGSGGVIYIEPRELPLNDRWEREVPKSLYERLAAVRNGDLAALHGHEGPYIDETDYGVIYAGAEDVDMVVTPEPGGCAECGHPGPHRRVTIGDESWEVWDCCDEDPWAAGRPGDRLSVERFTDIPGRHQSPRIRIRDDLHVTFKCDGGYSWVEWDPWIPARSTPEELHRYSEGHDAFLAAAGRTFPPESA